MTTISIHPPATSITFDAALLDLEHGSPKARTRAAHALGDVTDPEERVRAVRLLIDALGSSSGDLRLEAALSLGDLAQESAVVGLAQRLDDDVPSVRQAAAIALGKLGFRSGFDALAAKLAEGPADLRYQAATSLVEIDCDAAYEPLVTALDDDDPQVLGAIALALGAVGDSRAIEPLLGLLEHQSQRARFDAAYALAKLDEPRARSVLEHALSADEEIWDAIEGLEQLGKAEACEEIAKLFQRGKLELAAVRAAGAVLVLDPAASTAPSARELLTKAITARRLEVAGLAVEMAARAGGDWARDALERARTTRRGRRLADEIDTALADLSGPTA